MKKLTTLAIVACISLSAGWMDNIKDMAKSYTSQKSDTKNSSETQSAIKQALELGVKKALGTLGKENGFYKNPLVKIGLPKNVQTVASTLRSVGMGKYVDQFELSMNRAAEEAIPETANILMDTVKEMRVEDAKKLVMSDKPDAISEYFKQKAGKKLESKIAPIIKKHMENENVTKYYQTMMSYYEKYGKRYTKNSYAQAAMGALGIKQDDTNQTDLSSYVTHKTLEGIYKMIAQEEKAIRTSAAARTTQLLQKVFGGK